ncbi:MAG: LysM peptidoglycan-binding domain-containing protein [Anaerolineae bacterium]|nr:LysM peptidoglycan-binding domain-containing protein [Anaerolineae bacterium]
MTDPRRGRWLALLLCLLLSAVTLRAQTPPPAADLPQPGLTIYVVQRHDTLYDIAQAYSTTIDYLVEINSLNSTSRILVGQRLLVPAGDSVTPVPRTHIIQPGETLAGIAAGYGQSLAALMQANNILNADQIYAGQVLQIVAPAAGNAGVATPPAPAGTAPTLGANLHTVQSGETLFKIAMQYGLTVNDLAAANGLVDLTLIYAGQQLVIPGTAVEPAALALPAPLTALAVSPLVMTEAEAGSLVVTTATPATVTFNFLNRAWQVVATDGGTRHVVLLAVPMFTAAGIYPAQLSVSGAGGPVEYTFNLRVLAGGYGTQNINVSDELAPLLAPAPQAYELDLLTRITSPVTQTRAYTGIFSLPAAAAMNSPFGTRRSYNGGEANTFHTGADFASAPGAPILAAAPGQVVLADLLSIRGNSIVIDHGWGVYSVYCHLSAINVDLGQMVTAGQVIGAAGATGRITGPHLHWEIWVSGVPVNPLTWLTRSFP